MNVKKVFLAFNFLKNPGITLNRAYYGHFWQTSALKENLIKLRPGLQESRRTADHTTSIMSFLTFLNIF